MLLPTEGKLLEDESVTLKYQTIFQGRTQKTYARSFLLPNAHHEPELVDVEINQVRVFYLGEYEIKGVHKTYGK